MRRLLLMRHAKSDWSEPGQNDSDRRLNPRGLRDAPRMARWMQSVSLAPTLILASTAKRVSQTVDLLCSAGVVRGGDWQPTVMVREDLYLAPPETILRAVRADGGDHESVLVVAHNPGLESLVMQLTGEIFPYPTAAIAVFQRIPDQDWSVPLRSDNVKLEHFARPKAIAD